MAFLMRKPRKKSSEQSVAAKQRNLKKRHIYGAQSPVARLVHPLVRRLVNVIPAAQIMPVWLGPRDLT
jgi:hypothetical protein